MSEETLTIGGVEFPPGTLNSIDLPLPRLYTHTRVSMPVRVFRGVRPGPRLFICSALHGDELNGLEIIRRVAAKIDPAKLSGDVICVPVVNVFGFLTQSRYLPDRRDLNRSFPGSARGSLTARVAHIFMKEIVQKCTHGIDLHTAAVNRANLPQLRGNLADAETRLCAEAFGAPVIIQSDARDGSLREAAAKKGIRTLVFEAGEALRFNEEAIRVGVQGIMRVMRALRIKKGGRMKKAPPPAEAVKTRWVRAKKSGVMRLSAALGDRVSRGQALGVISDPFDEKPRELRSPSDGLVIGEASNPLAHRGDAVVHLGILKKNGA